MQLWRRRQRKEDSDEIEPTDEPQIDPELDAEFAEPPEDRARRVQWIKFYVKEGDEQKALDLGWDGRPFKQEDEPGPSAAAQPPASGFRQKADASKSIVRLSNRVDDLFAEMTEEVAVEAVADEPLVRVEEEASAPAPAP